MLIGINVRAKKIQITAYKYSIRIVIFQHNNTILYIYSGSRFIRRHRRREIHQDKKLSRLEDIPRNGVLTALRKYSS